VQRGDIHQLRLPKGVGHEPHGRRLAVILQNDAMLPRSVVIVAPTSASARPASFRPEIVIGRRGTRVLVEQLGAVAVERLGDQVGRVTIDEQWQIDAALLTVLGLN
jgi:mRNA interferase MazF